MTISPRVKSPIADVYWDGWRSDTLTLMQHGWNLSVREQPRHQRIQLTIQHPSKRIHGLSQEMSFDYMMMLREPSMRIPLRFNMMMGDKIQVVVYGESIQGWNPIDAVPSFEHGKIVDDHSLFAFRELPPVENDVIIPKPSFTEILRMALDHQAPKQKELREKARQNMGAILRVAA